MHKFELRPRKNAEGISVGANMQLLMDGKPMKGVTKVKIEVEARKVAKINVTFIGKLETHAISRYNPYQIPKVKPKKVNK